MSEFSSKVYEAIHSPLMADGIDTLQVNIGRHCNQRCLHCHVDAGPDKKTEFMSRETMGMVLKVLAENEIHTLDITGGAPELHPGLGYLLEGAASLGKKAILRSNLSALLLPGNERLIGLLVKNRVEIIASLPCYLEKNVDSQRGAGVYKLSIQALKLLNDRGYGKEGSGLALHLVYNPAGAVLPGRQDALESDYKRELQGRHGIVFNKLLAITNMPIGRFKETLLKGGNYESYAAILKKNFNKETIPELMCRKMLSISWDGRIFDCDFNQMLELTVNHGAASLLSGFDLEVLKKREIMVGDHCFGCAAGRGSSCGGEIRSGLVF
ncbi:MAG: arsenosugar biosynthesis radical SAM protein ArsS [Nitrospinae bacterium]|nr:arsenosugar biosynthesis radical SAM protein ArsS [Nitrospinota bacterium]